MREATKVTLSDPENRFTAFVAISSSRSRSNRDHRRGRFILQLFGRSHKSRGTWQGHVYELHSMQRDLHRCHAAFVYKQCAERGALCRDSAQRFLVRPEIDLFERIEPSRRIVADLANASSRRFRCLWLDRQLANLTLPRFNLTHARAQGGNHRALLGNERRARARARP